MQNKTIVFLTPRPISTFEEEKLGLRYLINQGLDVRVIELTKLLYKRKNIQDQIIKSVEGPLQGDYIHRVNSYAEFENLLGSLSNRSLFIDYVVSASDIPLNAERIFRLLKKHKARFSFISSGALPLPSLSASAAAPTLNSRWHALGKKVFKAVAHPNLFVDVLASKVIVFLSRHRLFYPLPIIIFGGDSEFLQRYIETRRFDKELVVPINSLDYDACNTFLREHGNILPESDDICVFLDEAATHHSDCNLLGIEPADSKVYFEKMNGFFDFVEENTGYRVVIAAHPRSKYESMPDMFGGRDVIKGRTVELVAKSKLVVMHLSTSLSYAVFFKKPVISVRTPGVRVLDQLERMVGTMAEAIGNTPVDLVNDELTLSLLDPGCNLEKYSEYEMRYVRSKRADSLPLWGVVVREVNKMS